MTDTKIALGRLRKRSEFLYVQKGRYKAQGSIVLQMREQHTEQDNIRVGFTASKKVGNAVIRNRAKRRMREAARAVLPLFAQCRYDYVIIARASIIDRSYEHLLDDLKKALISLHSRRQNA